jgi:hypothetical protein
MQTFFFIKASFNSQIFKKWGQNLSVSEYFTPLPALPALLACANSPNTKFSRFIAY